ncbi:hypothetical protein ACLOJK_027061, partial [Asimina triloba]
LLSPDSEGRCYRRHPAIAACSDLPLPIDEEMGCCRLSASAIAEFEKSLSALEKTTAAGSANSHDFRLICYDDRPDQNHDQDVLAGGGF